MTKKPPCGGRLHAKRDGENSLALWVAKRPEGVRKQLITVFPRRCPSPQARKVAPKVTERIASPFGRGGTVGDGEGK